KYVCFCRSNLTVRHYRTYQGRESFLNPLHTCKSVSLGYITHGRRSPIAGRTLDWECREAARAFLGGASGAIPICPVLLLTPIAFALALAKGALCALSVSILKLQQWICPRCARREPSRVERLRRQELFRPERALAQSGRPPCRADSHQHRSDR